MSKVKLIASDIDGTLISSEGICTPKTIEAIKKARQQGIKFAICSGRPVSGILPLLEGWHLNGLCDYIVGMNGGEILNCETNKKATCYPLEENVIQDIIDIYEPMGFQPTVYDDSGFYVDKITEQAKIVANRTATTLKLGDVRALNKGPQPKLMFVVEPSRMQEIEEYYNAHLDPRYVAFKTAVDLFEFSNPMLAKDIGIEIICTQMHITQEEVIAFGDTTNDIQMLKEAGVGVCMANGTQDAKDVSDVITKSCDEDGIADYLNKVL